MQLTIGTELQGGKYRILEIVGQGGFGITYLAEQTSLGRKVAIKEFFMKELCNRDADTSYVTVPSIGSRELVERFRQKFLKEARSIASLEHKNIVPIIDVFEENGTAYYVMKNIAGGSLADKVKSGALPESDAVRYIRQVASALEFVHSKRMMHLDVKPANILLDDTDSAVLIDFGLAKQYDDAGTQTSTTPVGISHGYAPMEQYKRGGVGTFSPATDIYSLGATLYKLVTGVTPPEASDVGNEGLPVLPSDISLAVRGAIEAAMQFRVKDRPQSIEAFLEMIERAASKDESGKSGSSDDCPPVLRGTSVAEGVNESPATDDGETVVENSADTVISNNSRSCHPERSEGSHPAGSVIFRDKPSTTRSDRREKSPKSASEESHPTSKEILPPSGRQNDKIVNGRQNDNANSNKRGWSWILILLLLLVVGGIGAWLMFAGGGISNSTVSKKDTKEEVKIESTKIELKVDEGKTSAAQDEAQQQQHGISTDQKVDLGLSVYWAGWNVGATSPEYYGDYYAWGETNAKSSYTEDNSSTYGKSMGSIAGNSTYDVARAKWGGSWRMPTKDQFQELLDRCTWTWTTYKGVDGYKVTGPNGNSIFLPAAGWRYGTSLGNEGSLGYYWSATPDESGPDGAYYLLFIDDDRFTYWNSRYYGCSVRPVSQN